MNRTINRMMTGLTGAMLIGLSSALPSLAQQSVQPMQVAQASDRDQITRLVVQSLRSGGGTARAEVFSIRIVGDYALAGWTYGETGGQMLLRRDGSWRVVDAGGGVTSVAELRRLGVPTDAIAEQLLAE